MKLSLLITVAIIITIIGTDVASAQTTFENPIIFDSVQGLITAFVRALIVILIPVVVFFIIFAGFKYVTAQGNPGQISDAHKALLYGLIGGVIILGAFAILSIVENTVNEFRTAVEIIRVV
jgi:hypothetical protein